MTHGKAIRMWSGMAAGLLLLGALAAGAVEPVAPAVPPVPEGHPRVYVRPADLPAIRAKLDLPEFSHSWETIRRAADDDGSGRSAPMAGAFLYLVQGDRVRGRRAAENMLSALAASTNQTEAGRVLDSPFHWAACVYDWCYDLLTPEEKQAAVKEFERIAGLHSPGYPAGDRCLAVVGHDSEGWLLTGQLPAGVAIYDENRTMYDAAASLFLRKYVPPRNYHYAGHSHHQGSHYSTRLVYDLSAAWLFRRLGAGDVFSRDLRFVPYENVYCLRPDGEQVRRGDSTSTGSSGRKRAIMILAAAYFEDPVLLGMAQGGYFSASCKPMEEVFDLLFRPAGLAPRPMVELPTAKLFPAPIGDMVARTGWTLGPDSRDVIVYMRLGGTFFGNHQKRDMGTFQIYYRGPLAIASGSYEGGYGTPHWLYAHETLASNGLLIFDPEEETNRRQIRAGGQMVPRGQDHPRDLEALLTRGYEQGDITGYGMGPDPRRPEYACLAGDITRAYGPKAERVTRSMATLFTGDPRCPAVLVVYDHVVAAKEEFRKTWLLHTLQEPVIEERGATVVCDGPTPDGKGTHGGKLHVRSLLPRDAAMRTVGGPGREFWVESAATNFAVGPDVHPVEAGAWRLEISPGAPRREDEFLTVLTVMDAETTGAPPAARRIESGDAVGVSILGRTVMFGRRSGAASRLSFALDGEGPLVVCGVEDGRWRVMRDGRDQEEPRHLEAGSGTLHLSGVRGRYVLERVDTAAASLPVKPAVAKPDGG